MNSITSLKTKAGDRNFWEEQRNLFLIQPSENYLCHACHRFNLLWAKDSEFKQEVLYLARTWAQFNNLNPDNIVGDVSLFRSHEIPHTIPGYKTNRLTDDHKQKVRLMFMEWVLEQLTDKTPKVLKTKARSKKFWMELYPAFIKSEHNFFCPSSPEFSALWKDSGEFRDELFDLIEEFSNHTFGSKYIFPRNSDIVFGYRNLHIVLRVFPELYYKPKLVRIAFLEWVIKKLS